MKAVAGVLLELNAHTRPLMLAFNKTDKIEPFPDLRARLKREHPGAAFISALHQSGLDDLANGILRHLEERSVEMTLQLPQSEAKLLSLRVKLRRDDARRLQKKLATRSSPDPDDS